jgi:hypothetical protein
MPIRLCDGATRCGTGTRVSNDDGDCQSGCMKSRKIIAGCLLAGLLLLIGDISVRVYLKTHATRWSVNGWTRFRIVMYRYPRLRDIPESFGFGQGFVQLQEVASGKVLAQKRAEDLAPLTAFKWSTTNVIIFQVPEMNKFVEWDLPK